MFGLFGAKDKEAEFIEGFTENDIPKPQKRKYNKGSKKPKLLQCNFRLTQDEKLYIETEAKKQSITVSAYVLLAVKQYRKV
jgi:hypothetical protein